MADKTKFRKICRISLLALFWIGTLLIPLIISLIWRQYIEVEFDSTLPITGVLKNCEFYIDFDQTISPGKLKIEMETSGKFIQTNQGLDVLIEYSKSDTFSFTLENKHSLMDTCFARLSLNSETVLTSLDLDCQNDCRLIQAAEGVIQFNDQGSSLKLQAEHGSVNLLGVSVDNIAIAIEKGDIYIAYGEIRQASSLTTEQGDVVIQSSKSFTVDFILDSFNFCFQAPKVQKVGAFQGCLEKSDTLPDSKPLVIDCRGVANICASSSCTNTGPTIKVQALDGNIYANIISEQTAVANQDHENLQGIYYQLGIDFSPLMYETLENILVKFNDTSKVDSGIIADLGNINAQSSHAIRYFLSTKSAYVDMKPWWVSTFSATLLLSQKYKFGGRLAPGFCPWTPELNSQQLGKAALLVSKAFQASLEQIALVYSDELPEPGEHGSETSFGYRSGSGQDIWYRVSQSADSNFSLSESKLEDHQNLYAAVWLSLSIAAMCSLVGFVASIIILNKVFRKFEMESVHIRKYAKSNFSFASNEEVDPDEEEGPDDSNNKKIELQYLQLVERADYRQRLEDEKKQKKKTTGLLKILKNLPPPFAIVDHFIYLVRKNMQNSMALFYRTIMVEVEEDELDDFSENPVLSDLKLQYERYCFLNAFRERQLNSEAGEKLLKKYGYMFETKVDTSTEVFRKIKFLFHVDEKNLNLGHDTSLENFVRNYCELTGFEEDQIIVDDFAKRYNVFCDNLRLKPDNITKMAMSAFDVDTDKLQVKYIVPLQQVGTEADVAQNKKKKFYNMDLTKLQFEIETLVTEKFAFKYDIIGAKEKGWVKFWYVVDIVSVFVHIIAMLIMCSPGLVLTMFFETEYSSYTLADWNKAVTTEDFIVSPWTLLPKFLLFKWWSYVIIALFFLFAIMVLVELVRYYLRMQFPIDTLKWFDSKQNGSVKRPTYSVIIQAIVWGFIFFQLAVIVGYIILVLVWFLLAAIINPTAYLPFAAGALTLVAFVIAKVTSFKDIQKKGMEVIQKFIEKHTKKIVDQVMQKILENIQLPGDMQDQLEEAKELAADPEALKEKIKQKVFEMIQNSPIGQELLQMGIEVETAYEMMMGNQEAIEEFAKKRGLPWEVATGLLAIIMKDSAKLKYSIQSLATHPAIDVPPFIVNIILTVFQNPSVRSMQNSSNQIVVEFFRMMLKKLEDSGKINFPHIKALANEFTQMFQALKFLKEEKVSSFLNVLSGINAQILKEVKNQMQTNPALAQDESDNESPQKKKKAKKLFNGRMPSFALPQELIYVLDMAKLVISQRSNVEINLKKLKLSIFNMAASSFGLDQNITNFFALIFSNNKSIMTDASGNQLIGDKLQQLIEGSARSLGIDPALLGVVIKMLFNDKSLNEDSISSLAELLVRKLNFPEAKTSNGEIDEELQQDMMTQLVKLAYGLFSCLKISNFKKSLKEDAPRFGVSGNQADLIITMACNFDSNMSQQVLIFQLFSLLGGDLISTLSKKLSIAQDETLGIMCILNGDLNSQFSEMIIKQFCERHKFPKKYVFLIKAMLNLCCATDTGNLLSACKTMQLTPYLTLLQMSRGLIHPYYVGSDYFAKVGLPPTAKIIQRKKFLFGEGEISKWVQDLRGSMNFECNPDFADGQLLSNNIPDLRTGEAQQNVASSFAKSQVMSPPQKKDEKKKDTNIKVKPIDQSTQQPLLNGSSLQDRPDIGTKKKREEDKEQLIEQDSDRLTNIPMQGTIHGRFDINEKEENDLKRNLKASKPEDDEDDDDEDDDLDQEPQAQQTIANRLQSNLKKRVRTAMISKCKLISNQFIVQNANQFIGSVMNLEFQTIDADLVKKLLRFYNHDPEKPQAKDMPHSKLQKLSQFLSIKDVINGKNSQLMMQAVNNFSGLFGYDEEAMRNFVQVMKQSGDRDSIAEGVNTLFEDKDKQSKSSQLDEYSKFVSDKVESLQGLQDIATNLSRVTQIPRFIINNSIAKFQSKFLTVHDILRLFMWTELRSDEGLEEQGVNLQRTVTDERSLMEFGMDIKQRMVNGKKENVLDIKLERLRFALGNLAQGQVVLQDLKYFFNMDENAYGPFLDAMQTIRPRFNLQVLKEQIVPILSEKYNQKEHILQRVLGILAFFRGFGDEFTTEADHYVKQGINKVNIDMFKFLGRKLQVIPEFLQVLNCILQKDNKNLANNLTALFRKSKDFGIQLMQPEYVQGMLSFITSTNYSVESLSEKLGINQHIMEIFLIIQQLSKSNIRTVPDILKKLKESEAFSKFIEVLGLPKDAIIALMYFTFCEIYPNTINQHSSQLKIMQHMDLNIAKSLLAISKGFNNKDIYRDFQFEAAIGIMEETRDGVISTIGPFAKLLHIDKELATIVLRLRQGDFKILDKFDNYLLGILPTPYIRDLAKAVCGFITNPIPRHIKMGSEFQTKKVTCDFEGSMALLCETLGIHPLVIKLCCFDSGAFKYCEKEFQFDRNAIIALLGTIANFSAPMMKYIMMRECLRQFNIRQYELEKLKLSIIQGDSPTQTMTQGFFQPGQKQKQYTIRKMVEKKGDIKDYYEYQNKDKELILESLNNFEKSGELMSGNEQEILETIMFNQYRNMHGFAYDKLSQKEYQKRTLDLPDWKLKSVLGNQADFYEGLQKQFFARDIQQFADGGGANNSSEEEGGLDTFVGMKINYLKEKTRKKCRNVWAQFRQLMKKISNDGKEDKEKGQQASRVNLAQFCFVTLLLGLKRYSDGGRDLKNNDIYLRMVADVDALMIYIDNYILFHKNEQGPSFSKFRFLKMLDIAMNIKISNSVQESFAPSLLTQENFYKFQSTYKNAEEVHNEVENLSEHFEKLKDTYFAAHIKKNPKKFLGANFQPIILRKKYLKCNPYSKTETRRWRHKLLFHYEATQFPMDKQDGENKQEQIRVAKNMMVKLYELGTEDQPDQEKVDEVSKIKLYSVVNLMSKLERLLITERDAIDLLCALARGEVNAFVQFQNFFKRTGMVKSEQTLESYMCFFGLLCFHKNTEEYLEQSDHDPDLEPPNVKKIMAIVQKQGTFNVGSTEDFLFLCHGKFDQMHYQNISQRFRFNSNYCKAFLYGSKSISDRLDFKQFQRDMGPLLQFLSIDTEICFTLVQIMHGDLEGLVKLGNKICRQKIEIDSQIKRKLSLFLDLIDQNLMNEDTKWLDLLKSDYEPQLIHIIEAIEKEEQEKINKSNKKSNKKGKVKEEQSPNNDLIKCIQILHYCMAQDFQKLAPLLIEEREILFGDSSMESIDIFQSLSILTQRNNDKISVQEKVDAINTLSKVFSCLLVAQDKDKEAQYRQKLEGLILTILGTCIWDIPTIRQGAQLTDPSLAILIECFLNISLLKKFRQEGQFDMIRAKYQEQGQPLKFVGKLLKSLDLLSQIILKNTYLILPQKDEQVDYEKRIQSAIGGIREVSGSDNQMLIELYSSAEEAKKWKEKAQKKIDTEYSDTLDDVLQTNDPVSFLGRDPNLMKGDTQQVVSIIFRSIVKGDFKDMLAVIVSNIDQFGDELKQPIDLILMLLKFHHIKPKDFLKMIQSDKSSFVEKFSQQIVGILSQFMERQSQDLDGINNELSKEYKEKSQTLKKYTKYLPMIFKLFMALKNNLITRPTMVTYIMKFSDCILDIIKSEGFKKIDFFDSLFKGMLGFSRSEAMDMSKKPYKASQRVNFTLEFFINMFFEDLKKQLPLMQKLIKVADQLFQGSMSLNQFKQNLGEFAENLSIIFGIKPTIIKGMAGVLNQDFSAVVEMAKPIAKINTNMLDKTMALLKSIQTVMGVLTNKGKGGAGGGMKAKEVAKEVIEDIVKKLKEGKAGFRELFLLIDAEGDNSGYISTDEFKALLNRIGIKLSDHRVGEIFTSAKSAQSQKDKPGEVNCEEFQAAMKYLIQKQALGALEMLGITTTQLVILFLVLLIILILLFAFIFLGISAFSTGGSFGSIINSMMPMGAGGAVGKKSAQEGNEEEKEQQAGEAVDQVGDILQNE